MYRYRFSRRHGRQATPYQTGRGLADLWAKHKGKFATAVKFLPAAYAVYQSGILGKVFNQLYAFFSHAKEIAGFNPEAALTVARETLQAAETVHLSTESQALLKTIIDMKDPILLQQFEVYVNKFGLNNPIVLENMKSLLDASGAKKFLTNEALARAGNISLQDLEQLGYKKLRLQVLNKPDNFLQSITSNIEKQFVPESMIDDPWGYGIKVPWNFGDKNVFEKLCYVYQAMNSWLLTADMTLKVGHVASNLSVTNPIVGVGKSLLALGSEAWLDSFGDCAKLLRILGESVGVVAMGVMAGTGPLAPLLLLVSSVLFVVAKKFGMTALWKVVKGIWLGAGKPLLEELLRRIDSVLAAIGVISQPCVATDCSDPACNCPACIVRCREAYDEEAKRCMDPTVKDCHKELYELHYKLPQGKYCSAPSDCESGRCYRNQCLPKAAKDERCDTNDDCASALCAKDGFFSLKRCRARPGTKSALDIASCIGQAYSKPGADAIQRALDVGTCYT